MIRITLMDGGFLEIPRDTALELLPYRHVLASPTLKSPIEALISHRGKLIPVLGPLPEQKNCDPNASVDTRPWILLMKDCAQIIRGLPTFEEAASTNVIQLQSSSEEESTLLDELDDLLKGA